MLPGLPSLASFQVPLVPVRTVPTVPAPEMVGRAVLTGGSLMAVMLIAMGASTWPPRLSVTVRTQVSLPVASAVGA
jgi:hypothetical protein